MPTNFKNKIRCDEKKEIFLANLQIKLDRIERPHCIASKAKHHSLINVLTKYSVVTNCK